VKIYLLFTLTIINLLLLLSLLAAHLRPAWIGSDAPVIRSRALEIIDDRGRVRASIKVHPSAVFEPTGKLYPETIMFRLIDQNGRPEVKLGASDQGGGISFVGSSDGTQVLLQAEGSQTSL
jgi:hypothetical protein